MIPALKNRDWREIARKRKAAEVTDDAEKKEVKEGETAAEGEPDAKKVRHNLFISD